MNFDWSISLSDLALVGGGIFAFFKVYLGMRDTLRDLTAALKGVRGQVDDHEDRIRGLERS